MSFGALLDANALFGMPLCDTLLRLGELELYDPFWSERILDEMVRSLVDTGRATEEAARWRVEKMNKTFEAAQVSSKAIAQLEPSMNNDPGDRHVLAAAVASSAQIIVTFNVNHFPDDACEPFGIEARHPDEFLVNLRDLAPDQVRAAIDEQAAQLTNPPLTFDEVLDRLAHVVPAFAEAVRNG
jgi:predicted nucleic acid-binding protein